MQQSTIALIAVIIFSVFTLCLLLMALYWIEKEYREAKKDLHKLTNSPYNGRVIDASKRHIVIIENTKQTKL